MPATVISKLSATAVAAAALALVVPSAASAAGKMTTKNSACKPVSVKGTSGSKKLKPYCRLAPIVDGRVPCADTVTGKFRSCRYTRDSGTWLSGRDGGAFAVVGDMIDSRFQVATRFKQGDLPPCLKRAGRPKARAADATGTASATDGAAVCRIETLGSTENSGPDLISYSNNEICVSNSVHPDGALGGWNGLYYCYRGNGAVLVDQYGMEFDQWGNYFPSSGDRCHMYQYTVNGTVYQGIAMKAPSLTRTNPAQIIKGTLYRWQPYRSTADAIDGM